LGLEHILALAIGPDGDVYVTDTSHQVAVIAPDGSVLRRWGGLGSAPGDFRFIPAAPSDRFDIHAKIAVGSDGRVYVSDPGNHRIQVFTPAGRFLDEVGSFGSGKGQFLDPNWLSVDHEGNLYVGDGALGGVSKFSPDGRFIWRIGGNGSSDLDLEGHQHFLSVDAHDRLVTKSGSSPKVLYIDSAGHVVDSFVAGQCDVSVDAFGYTFTNGDGNCDAGVTKVFDRAHRLVGEWLGPDDPLSTPPVFGPHGLAFAVGPNGSLLRLQISLRER
jgi:hypothetical protein